MNSSLPIVVAITGASGVIYGIKLLEALKNLNVKTIACISDSGYKNLKIETDYNKNYINNLADLYVDNNDLSACIASGSFKTKGMIVAPCSIKTMSSIANSFNYNLITRASDVCLKEKRPLVLMVRETPLHYNHLQQMSNLSLMGANIVPPVVSFYHQPKTIDDIINHSIGKCLDLLSIEHNLFKRWN